MCRSMSDETEWASRLGQTVRSNRKSIGYSQEALADLCGVDVRYLGGIERGQENPSLKVIVALASALRVPPSDLLK